MNGRLRRRLLHRGADLLSQLSLQSRLLPPAGKSFVGRQRPPGSLSPFSGLGSARHGQPGLQRRKPSLPLCPACSAVPLMQLQWLSARTHTPCVRAGLLRRARSPAAGSMQQGIGRRLSACCLCISSRRLTGAIYGGLLMRGCCQRAAAERRLTKGGLRAGLAEAPRRPKREAPETA